MIHEYPGALETRRSGRPFLSLAGPQGPPEGARTKLRSSRLRRMNADPGQAAAMIQAQAVAVLQHHTPLCTRHGDWTPWRDSMETLWTIEGNDDYFSTSIEDILDPITSGLHGHSGHHDHVQRGRFDS